MVQSNQITPGMTISISRKLYRVESSVKVTVPKGAPFIKTKLRDLTTNKVIEKNFKLEQEVKDVSSRDRNLEFLYVEGKDYLFLDINNLEQILIPSNVVGEQTRYLKEGTEIKASLYGDTVFSIELPQFLELMVEQTEGEEELSPLTNATKIAILETGAKVEVPPFIEIGDIIKIDTKTEEYIQRV
ncbi:MAG: Elongation factor P [Chlamydiae bacterium]|nr:Elongation factor P [Chlamydiota bacterium]